MKDTFLVKNIALNIEKKKKRKFYILYMRCMEIDQTDCQPIENFKLHNARARGESLPDSFLVLASRNNNNDNGYLHGVAPG